MASETTIARERNVNPLNSERARRSGHTRADYIDLYNAQKGGIRTLYAKSEISEREYNRRMAEVNQKLERI